jgi:hypothetical protein
MNIQFKNNFGKSFLLGSVSIGFLDQKNVFDAYQEDLDEMSEIIFNCTKAENLKSLSEDIKTVTNYPNLREDIKSKLLMFSQFLVDSDSVTAIIV